MSEEKKNYDLEERLISFSVNILNLAEQLPNTRNGNYIGGQIIRSGTAPALIRISIFPLSIVYQINLLVYLARLGHGQEMM